MPATSSPLSQPLSSGSNETSGRNLLPTPCLSANPSFYLATSKGATSTSTSSQQNTEDPTANAVAKPSLSSASHNFTPIQPYPTLISPPMSSLPSIQKNPSQLTFMSHYSAKSYQPCILAQNATNRSQSSTLPINPSSSSPSTPNSSPLSTSTNALADLLDPSHREQLLAALSPKDLLQIEKTIQKLKRKKTPLPLNSKKRSSKPKAMVSHSEPDMLDSGLPSPPHALPATEPIFTFRDGIEYLLFQYSVKGTIKEIEIKINIDSIDVNRIDHLFKKENCLYPRAHLPKEEYIGNRWEYESQCNILGWKLAFLNAKELEGKRGLLQRAVDSLRNRYPDLRSRRVIRLEKLQNGTLRRRSQRDPNVETCSVGEVLRHGSGGNKKVKTFRILTVETLVKGVVKRHRFKLNDNINEDDINLEFKKANAVYPRAMVTSQELYTGHRWDMERTCNEIGWKLAWANQQQLSGKRGLLQKAVDEFRSKFTELKPRRGRVTNTIKLLMQNMQQQQQQPSSQQVQQESSHPSHFQQHLYEPSVPLSPKESLESSPGIHNMPRSGGFETSRELSFCNDECGVDSLEVNLSCDASELSSPANCNDELMSLFPEVASLHETFDLNSHSELTHQALLDALQESGHQFL